MAHVHTDQQIADILTNGSFTRDEWDELMLLFGMVLESHHRSPFSAVATLVPLAQQMAKRSHPFTDEASKYTGASSKSKPAGKIVVALASVRYSKELTVHHRSRKDAIRCQRPGQSGQASGDRLHFSGVPGTGRPVANGSTIR